VSNKSILTEYFIFSTKLNYTKFMDNLTLPVTKEQIETIVNTFSKIARVSTFDGEHVEEALFKGDTID